MIVRGLNWCRLKFSACVLRPNPTACAPRLAHNDTVATRSCSSSRSMYGKYGRRGRINVTGVTGVAPAIIRRSAYAHRGLPTPTASPNPPRLLSDQRLVAAEIPPFLGGPLLLPNPGESSIIPHRRDRSPHRDRVAVAPSRSLRRRPHRAIVWCCASFC